MPHSGMCFCSAVLLTFLWSTDFLVSHSPTLASDPWAGVSTQLLYIMSTCLFSTSIWWIPWLNLSWLESTLNLESAKFCCTLCILDSEATQPVPGNIDPLIRPISYKLCHLLCLYRLIDILYDICSPDSIFRNSHYSRMESTGFPSKKASLPVLESPVQSGHLPIFGKTETETSL